MSYGIPWPMPTKASSNWSKNFFYSPNWFIPVILRGKGKSILALYCFLSLRLGYWPFCIHTCSIMKTRLPIGITNGVETYYFTKYRALLLLPFQALLTWLFFYKRYNLAEITVFWLYTLGLTYAIRILLLPLYIPLISYKGILDDSFTILSSFIILWQMTMLFGRVSNLGWLLLIVNLSYILDFVFQLYIIFGFHFFNNTIGINSWYDLIKIRYSL